MLLNFIIFINSGFDFFIVNKKYIYLYLYFIKKKNRILSFFTDTNFICDFCLTKWWIYHIMEYKKKIDFKCLIQWLRKGVWPWSTFRVSSLVWKRGFIYMYIKTLGASYENRWASQEPVQLHIISNIGMLKVLWAKRNAREHTHTLPIHNYEQRNHFVWINKIRKIRQEASESCQLYFQRVTEVNFLN